MGAMLNKFASFIGFDSTEEEEEIEDVRPVQQQKDEKVVKFNEFKNRNNTSRTPAPSLNTYEIEHVLLAPKKFEDAKRIADEIKAKKIITLNMSTVTFEVARRILDFISGTAYAVDSKITKVSEQVFISVPNKIRQTNELPSKDASNEILKDSDDVQGLDESEEIIRRIVR